MKLDEDVGKNSKEFEEEIERRKIGLGGAKMKTLNLPH